MSTLDLKVYDIFKNKLGEKEAEIIIDYFDTKIEKKITEKKEIFSTKDDLANLG